ncbi:AhpD-like protein [Pseudomassariella vexata]|uniref:AhpD-like protein n=1 Tax=Pseudomassariella vexata TaxID=1141098 RepID=A0A1Y2EJN0_9PEZI|nr:AhpD-like protein [Pseudomassariella vexata]ORY71759.1 AhpD-like protein [Pseudomassariella vexata]
MPVAVPFMTPALLSTIRKQKNLPHDTWYIIAATVLTLLNRPDEIRTVYREAMDRGPRSMDIKANLEEQLTISRRLREALIKASAVGGIPKSINALLSLKEVTPVHLLDEPGSSTPTGRWADMFEAPSSQILDRGQSFFNKVYGKVAKRIMEQMDRSGTEDLGLVARLVYGHLLSNTRVLSSAETSFVLIAGLIPQDVNPQLKGHLRGALNGGATVEEVRAVREVAVTICEAAGMTRLAENATGGWGWRSEVANV